MRTRQLRPPLPSPRSWWLHEARAHQPDETAPSLAGDLDVDVAVVGGGYTGLWTALALREREPSLRVALLEAREIGEGPSGRNGGFLHGYWSSLPTLRRVLGDGSARSSSRTCRAGSSRLCARSASGAARTCGFARAACCASRRGSRRTPRSRKPPATHASSASRRRPSCWTRPRSERAATRSASGTASTSATAATVQPARLALALKRRRDRRGRVAVRAHSCDHAGPSNGSARRTAASARSEIVPRPERLAGTALAARRPPDRTSAARSCSPSRFPSCSSRSGWTGGEAILDGRMFLHYFRTTPDGRVLMGSGSGRLGRGDRVDRRHPRRRAGAGARRGRGLRELLPALADAPIAARLDGPIDVSADRLPHFATEPGTRIHYGAGYTGNGVGPSWLGGADPRLAGARRPGRVDGAAARRAPGSAAATGAVPVRRRQACALGHAGRRGGGRRRPAAAARGARGGGDPAPARECRSGSDD